MPSLYLNPNVIRFEEYRSFCWWHNIVFQHLFDLDYDRIRIRLERNDKIFYISFDTSLMRRISFNELIDRLEFITRKLFRIGEFEK